MASERARGPERDWSPAIARRLVLRFLALWSPVAVLVVFAVTFLLTPAYNAAEEVGSLGRGGVLYGAPCVFMGAGLSHVFWHRLTDRAGYFSWMLTWTAMSVVAGVVFTGVFLSHAVRPLEGDTRWILSGGTVLAAVLAMGFEYLVERR